MTVTYCDVTKKPIENATTNYTWETRGWRYDTILNKDLSPDGMAKLENSVRKKMEESNRFDFMEHKRILTEKLKKLSR